MSLQPDNKVVVEFDADRDIVLTTGTRAAVRYLNLVGDRYLELVDGPGSTQILPAGSQIPVDRTAPALDLDLLLGGLKPVIQGLNPQDVNALTVALLQIFQGQGGTLQSLFTKTSSFSNALADNNQVIAATDRQPRHRAGHAGQGRRASSPAQSTDSSSWSAGCPRTATPSAPPSTSLDNGTASLADLLARPGRRWPARSTS